MAVCYMDGNYEISYLCTYKMREDLLEIKAEYEIDEEIEAVNGFKSGQAIWNSRKETFCLWMFKIRRIIS